ncbi:MAG: hypothetical protein IKQ40_03845 [Lachnospiraceae bacterium]|nr:hypothetical protein [Lachnospiraceae bacterium]
MTVAASIVLALFITLANYGIWQHPELPEVRSVLFVRLYKLLLILAIMTGSFFCTYCILLYTVYHTDSFTVLTAPVYRSGASKFLYFLIPFCVTAAVYLAIYFCCYWPGLMSLDSIDQVDQIFTGRFSNHQPFYHTMILGAFLNAGLSIFGNINYAVALYVTVQILFMAVTAGYVTMSMAELAMPKWMIATATLWYALMPYHIMYSFTVWKDVYFSAFITIMIILLIKIAREGGNFGRYLAFTIFSILICLIRSNGLFAYVFVFLGVLILLRKRRGLLFIMPAVTILAFVLKHNVLNSLGVIQPDTVESLSIPLQQISRVIKDDGNIAQDDMQFLSKIIDPSTIKEVYNPDISDPVKNAIRDLGDQDYLKDNLGQFFTVYLRTVIRNPMTVVTAWVDSTCGYWNSGYNYWVWFWDIEENNYGITRTVASEGMQLVMDEYLWMFYNTRIFQVFTAIGMFVWIVLVLFAKNIATANRAGIIAIIPILAVLLSLLVSSPVYAEFRYMYPLFTALPMLFAVTCAGASDGKNSEDGEDCPGDANGADDKQPAQPDETGE